MKICDCVGVSEWISH